MSQQVSLFWLAVIERIKVQNYRNEGYWRVPFKFPNCQSLHTGLHVKRLISPITDSHPLLLPRRMWRRQFDDIKGIRHRFSCLEAATRKGLLKKL